MTAREAYARVREMGEESEPQTEWYENGLVGIETRLHGRSGRWWIVLEVSRCVRSACRQFLPRDMRKRQMIVLPETAVVPVRGTISDLAGLGKGMGGGRIRP